MFKFSKCQTTRVKSKKIEKAKATISTTLVLAAAPVNFLQFEEERQDTYQDGGENNIAVEDTSSSKGDEESHPKSSKGPAMCRSKAYKPVMVECAKLL